MTIWTERLELLPVTLAVVEAVLSDDKARVEALVGAVLPDAWPGRALVERAFSAQIERIRNDPSARLWGDRILVTRDGRRIVGSVVFHGYPSESGVAELAYGIEEGSQGRGYATEGVRAAVGWALEQTSVQAVHATTTPWHQGSIRVLEKVGMVRIGVREHDVLGDLLLFERRK